MPARGLLAQLTATKFSGEAENIATEALAYLACTYPGAARGLWRRCREIVSELPPIDTWTTQLHASDDSGIPDMAGHAVDGSVPVLIEAKFWAGLTDNQPVTYLHRLDAAQPGLLLVVAPARRLGSLWLKLRERTNESFGGEDSHNAHVVRFGAVSMAAVSWDSVTAAMRRELEVERDVDGLADLSQLVGLCEFEDQSELLPFTSEELTGNLGRRILDLETIIAETTAQLMPRVLDTTGLTWSASSSYIGRYVRIRGWEALFHINFGRWATEYPTPLWLQITDNAAATSPELRASLEPLASAVPPRLFTDGAKLQLPIELAAGAEREELVEAVARQIVAFYELLPDGPKAGGPSA